jgi:hypothetical protein
VESEFDSQQEQDAFLFSTALKVALGFIQPPIQWVFMVLFRGGRNSRNANMTFDLYLMQMLRMLYLHSHTYLHGVVLNQAQG